MSAPRSHRWLKIRTRMLGVVLVSGLTVLLVSTVATLWIVKVDKEAYLSLSAVHEASEFGHRLENAITRVDAELATIALSVETGRPMDAREIVSGDVVAITVRDETHELFSAGTTHELVEESRRWMQEQPDAIGPHHLGPSALVVAYRSADLRAVALVDTSRLLDGIPRTWSARLVPRDEVAHDGVSATRDEDGDMLQVALRLAEGPAMRMDAPLAPARAATSAVLWRMGVAALLSVLPLLALATFFSRRLGRPIVALAAAVERAEADEPILLPKLADDEVGTLGVAIHAMSARLSWDSRVLRRAVRYARIVTAADDAAEVLEALNRTLQRTSLGKGRWRVLTSDRLQAILGSPRAIAALGELTVHGHATVFLSEEGSLGTQLANGAGLHPTSDTLVVIPIRGDHASHGVLLGADVDEAAIRFSLLFVEIASAALDRRELARRAASSEKMAALGRLAGSIAHEVNNPLSYVLANLETARSEVSGELREILDDALGGAERVADIVRDVGLLARGGKDLQAEKLELGPVLEHALAVSRDLAPEVVFDIRAAASASVLGSARRVEQVVTNLLNNAADATRGCAERRVTLELRVEGRRALVVVSDTGAGVPDAVMPHLFEPFFTGKGERGTGLGLYLARTLARIHEGDIELVSTSATGTVFHFWLPIREMSTPGFSLSSEAAPSSSAPPPSRMAS